MRSARPRDRFAHARRDTLQRVLNESTWLHGSLLVLRGCRGRGLLRTSDLLWHPVAVGSATSF